MHDSYYAGVLLWVFLKDSGTLKSDWFFLMHPSNPASDRLYPPRVSTYKANVLSQPAHSKSTDKTVPSTDLKYLKLELMFHPLATICSRLCACSVISKEVDW